MHHGEFRSGTRRKADPVGVWQQLGCCRGICLSDRLEGQHMAGLQDLLAAYCACNTPFHATAFESAHGSALQVRRQCQVQAERIARLEPLAAGAAEAGLRERELAATLEQVGHI